MRLSALRLLAALTTAAAPLAVRAQDTTSRVVIRPWLASSVGLGSMTSLCSRCGYDTGTSPYGGGALDGTVGLTVTRHLAVGVRRLDFGALVIDGPSRHATFTMVEAEYLPPDREWGALRIGVGRGAIDDGGIPAHAKGLALGVGGSLRGVVNASHFAFTLSADWHETVNGRISGRSLGPESLRGRVLSVGVGVEGWFARY